MTIEYDKPTEPTTSRIPDFQRREEEAEFWDSHDFTEFLDETRPVKLRVRKDLSEGLAVRLDW